MNINPEYYDADGMARGAYESEKSPAELRKERELTEDNLERELIDIAKHSDSQGKRISINASEAGFKKQL